MPELQIEKMNRAERRARHIKFKGYQDPPVATHQVYYIPMKRKSRFGVEYIYYRKIIDKIKLKVEKIISNKKKKSKKDEI